MNTEPIKLETTYSELLGYRDPNGRYPDIQIKDIGDSCMVTIPAPYLIPRSIRVWSGSQHITIKGISGIHYKIFHRVIRLPMEILKREAFAHYHNGVLDVILPKVA